MRVLFCKIHFPFFFCKASSHLLHTPSPPLKLDNTPYASPPRLPPPPETSSLGEDQSVEFRSSSKGNESLNCNVKHLLSENGLKSILRKTSPDCWLVEKKKVQWADLFGKKLVEIREFKCNEDEDTNYRPVNNRRCVCTIL